MNTATAEAVSREPTSGRLRLRIWSRCGGQHELYNHVMPPNSLICANNERVGAFPASSRHPGGVNASFADGSVHFIKSTINYVTWWALGTKAGGEVTSADSY